MDEVDTFARLGCESPTSKPGKLEAGDLRALFRPFTGSSRYLHITVLQSHICLSSSVTRNFTADE